MSPQELGPGGIPIPDEDHTYLVTSAGFPVKNREAQAGDKYALAPLPYKYLGYTHKKGVDPESDKAKAQEKLDRATLDLLVLDLSQTPYGRQFLTRSYEAGFGFQHRPDAVRACGSDAINDRPSKSLWLGEAGYVPAIQLAAMHEIGHFLRCLGLADEAGLIGREPLIYLSDDGLERAVEIVRLQEGSSEADAARHAVECEFITNPNHYKPPGVFNQFAIGDYRKELAAAATLSAPLLLQGREAEFHQNVHQAFYTPKNLAYYDEQVLSNFNCWRPKNGGGDEYKAKYMADPPLTSTDVAKMLPYIAGFSFVHEPVNRALTDADETKKQYETLKGIVEAQYAGTKFTPRYTMAFMSEIQAAPTGRMLTRLDVDISQPVAPARVAPPLNNLAIMQLRTDNGRAGSDMAEFRQRA